MGRDAGADALIAEAMRRSGLIWLQSDDPPRRRARWHAWVDGSAYLLTGPDEQPDPGLGAGEMVQVVVRSKDTEQRLVVFTARASRLLPGDEDWEAATAELARKRLNLHDSVNAPQRWAAQDGYALYRLEPTGEITEGPGNYSDQSLRAAPVDTVATTIGRRPRMFRLATMATGVRRSGRSPPARPDPPRGS